MMTSKRFNSSDSSSEFVPLNRKYYFTDQTGTSASKKLCISHNKMERVANFSISSNSVPNNDTRKKQVSDKKVLAIRLVPGELYQIK